MLVRAMRFAGEEVLSQAPECAGIFQPIPSNLDGSSKEQQPQHAQDSEGKEEKQLANFDN
jgi:hypothetical protein